MMGWRKKVDQCMLECKEGNKFRSGLLCTLPQAELLDNQFSPYELLIRKVISTHRLGPIQTKRKRMNE